MLLEIKDQVVLYIEMEENDFNLWIEGQTFIFYVLVYVGIQDQYYGHYEHIYICHNYDSLPCVVSYSADF